MRVITGTARGRRLLEPKGREIRPTTDMVKEAVFSIVQFDVPGRRVLDLFAGTGQLGIEALSRGARECVFVDSAQEAVTLVKKNLAVCGFEANVIRADAQSYLARGGKFDLVFIDPPYQSGLYAPILEKAFGFDILTDGGIILVESLRGTPMPEAPAPYRQGRQYHYGKVTLTVYTKETV